LLQRGHTPMWMSKRSVVGILQNTDINLFLRNWYLCNNKSTPIFYKMENLYSSFLKF